MSGRPRYPACGDLEGLERSDACANELPRDCVSGHDHFDNLNGVELVQFATAFVSRIVGLREYESCRPAKFGRLTNVGGPE